VACELVPKAELEKELGHVLGDGNGTPSGSSSPDSMCHYAIPATVDPSCHSAMEIYVNESSSRFDDSKLSVRAGIKRLLTRRSILDSKVAPENHRNESKADE
jgi:hypothetical protein